MLKHGGRCGVVIKNTFLSNGDSASVALRKQLLEECELDTILDLPRGTFQGAGVQTVVLFFTKGMPTKNIFYYQLNLDRNLGKTNSLNENDLADFVTLSTTQANTENSWLVDVKDIDKTTWDLTVDNPNREDTTDKRTPEQILGEIEDLSLIAGTAIFEIKDLLDFKLPSDLYEIVELGKLCEILDNKRKPITKKDRKFGEYPYYGATGIVDYVADYIFDEKLVLIGEDGAKWNSGENTAFIVEGKYWVNNHAHVIKPNRKILMDEWLVYCLFFKDLNPFVTGLTVPKLNQGQLKVIPIPLPPLLIQQQLVLKLDTIFNQIHEANTCFEDGRVEFSKLKASVLSTVFKFDLFKA